MQGTSGSFGEARESGGTYLLEPEAKALCIEYGIPVVKFSVARNSEEAIRLAEELGYPVVLKIVSPDVVHKSDVGGVITQLTDAKEVKNAYQRILANVKKANPEARVTGVLVEEMAPPSTEVIVGATRTLQFGPVLMFGLGGILVEILKDVSFRAAPIDSSDALEMITELKAYSVLRGYRNQPPVDIDALVEILLKVSKLVIERPEIRGVDLNPVFAYERGAKVVDARISLQRHLGDKESIRY
jgi:acetyl-CoA synthetase (ADP-forming)